MLVPAWPRPVEAAVSTFRSEPRTHHNNLRQKFDGTDQSAQTCAASSPSLFDEARKRSAGAGFAVLDGNHAIEEMLTLRECELSQGSGQDGLNQPPL